MSQVYADRVQETTATTGTGTLHLAGAVAQFQTFVAAVGTGNTCDYCILSGNGTDWEVGEGTVTAGSPNTLSRDVIFDSSNSGSPINLSGTSTVFLPLPAYRYVRHIISSPGDTVLLATDSGTTFCNTGATGETDFTLPDWDPGLWFTFIVTTAQTLKIVVPSATSLYLGIDATSVAALSAQVGSSITIEATDDPGVWIATSMVGPWTLT